MIATQVRMRKHLLSLRLLFPRSIRQALVRLLDAHAARDVRRQRKDGVDLPQSLRRRAAEHGEPGDAEEGVEDVGDVVGPVGDAAVVWIL
jgi:hypothetical protein